MKGLSKLTRTNTITANALLNEISRYRFGEPDHRSLGGTVDTPVHDTCVEETHMSLTHRRTGTRRAIIGAKRITMNVVILQPLDVPLIGRSICYIVKRSVRVYLPFMLDATDAMLIMFPDFLANIYSDTIN